MPIDAVEAERKALIEQQAKQLQDSQTMVQQLSDEVSALRTRNEKATVAAKVRFLLFGA